ncbi:MAG: hypothetical protein AAF598_03280 [Bacteroidota bacterium]
MRVFSIYESFKGQTALEAINRQVGATTEAFFRRFRSIFSEKYLEYRHRNWDIALKMAFKATSRQLVESAVEPPSAASIISLASKLPNVQLAEFDPNETPCIRRAQGSLREHYYMEIGQRKVWIFRTIFENVNEHHQSLQALREFMEPGDLCLMESIDLSKGHVFPESQNFNRFTELMSEFQSLLGHPASVSDLEILRNSLSGDSVIEMGVPRLLNGNNSSFPARMLACIRPFALSYDMVSTMEYDAIWASMVHLQKDPSYVIKCITINRLIFQVEH